MLAASRICCISLRIAPLAKSPVLNTVLTTRTPVKNSFWRTFANDGREPWSTRGRRRTLKETITQPAGGTAFRLGKGALAGGAAFGIGALCFYGLGLSNKPGAIDQAVLWPQYVKDRIKATYMYFGGSIGITAASAIAAFRSPVIMNLVSRNSFLAIAGIFAAMIGSGMVVRGLPYKPGIGAKQLAWVVHTSILGAIIAPMCILGGPLMIRAAWYTAGVVGGLSAVAVCAPSDKFLNMSGPLAIGLGVVFASSLGSMFLPPTTMLGAGLYSMSLYGGLLLFSAFLLYDTQRIIRAAEVYPLYAEHPFDPVNASVSIYLDTLNIFVRILTILAGGGGHKKR